MLKRLFVYAVALACVHLFCSAGGVAAGEFRFSMDTPEGWWRVKSDKYLVITRDGAFKHYILAQERPLSKPFKNTADPNLTGLQMIENNPATVAGKPGFQLTFLYTDPAGIIFKTIYYGCINGERYYNLRYSGSEQKYFDEEAWKVFSAVRKSFRID